MKKILTILVVLFVHAIALADLPKTLTFATEATYPPFEFVAENGQIQGFDVDIVYALCKQMAVTCTFNNQPFDSLIPGLKIGKFDGLISGLNITTERQQQVDFTVPYYASTASFVSLRAPKNETSPQALKDKTVGIQAGTSLQNFLKAEYPNTKVKTYVSAQDAFLDLISGRVDFVFADTPVVLSWLKTNNAKNQYAIVGTPIRNEVYFGRGYGIAVKKENTALLAALNKALVQIKANGDYQKITKAYFDH